MTFRKIMLATVVSVLVAGCGGTGNGGGGDNIPTHNDTPSTQDLKDGLAYLNKIRKGAGLKEFRYYLTLEKAAKNHGDYLRDVYAKYGVNTTHEEPAQYESKYRTGQWGTERAHHAGYDGFWAGNDIAFDTSDGIRGAIRGLLTAVYHRFFIVSPEIDEVGLWALPHRDDALDAGLVNFGMRKNTMSILAEQSPGIILYPYSGQNDANTFFGGNESPNPLVGLEMSSGSGNPISVEFNKAKISNVTLKSFSLKDGSGAEVDIGYTLTSENDKARKLTDHQFAFFPRESLAYDETYTAKITYVADGVAGSKEWSFKTIAQPKEDGGDDSPQNQDINVTDTNQTVLVKAEQYYNLHILPVNDSIANGNTLGNLNYIDGKTANNKDNSVASYDKDNIIQVYVYGNSGDWAILEITNLQNSNTGEKFKVRLQVE